MKQATTIFVIAILAGAVGAGAVYGYYALPGGKLDQVEQQAYNQGYNVGTSSATRYVPPANIDFSISPTTLNYTAAVNASDDVASATYENATITIENKEDTGSATVRITLKVSGEDDGLPDALEKDEFQVYIHSTEGNTWLFGSSESDGEYHSGGYQFTIPANTVKTLTLATMMSACNDVFENGKTYGITVYLYQVGAGVNGAGTVIDSEKLTLTT